MLNSEILEKNSEVSKFDLNLKQIERAAGHLTSIQDKKKAYQTDKL